MNDKERRALVDRLAEAKVIYIEALGPFSPPFHVRVSLKVACEMVDRAITQGSVPKVTVLVGNALLEVTSKEA